MNHRVDHENLLAETRWNLPRQQESFDEFAFAANGHAGKFFEPFSFRHFRVGAQPI